MAPQHERVEPAPFDAAPPAADEPATARPTARSRWVLPALAVLALAALLVVFWLPTRFDGAPPLSAPDTVVPAPDPPRPAPAAPGAAAETERTPFAEAQAARLRSEAQDVLAELLDLRENLVSRGIERWDPEALAAVDELAASGDERYRERAYEAAIGRYREARDRARALEERLPAELAARQEAALAAIEAGAIDDAETAVAIAETIDPDNARNAELRERVAALPAVVSGLEAAAAAEDAGDLAAAVEALETATAADPAHERAAAALARISAALRRQRFTAAMSSGYGALEEEAFDEARNAFRRAGALFPGRGEVATALAELEVAETAARLRQLQRAAEQAAAEERWNAAVARYEEALALDASVLFAQRGVATARARAELDEALENALQDPDRYADPAVAADAESLLERGRRTAAAAEADTPRLERQLAALDQVLTRANTEVPVTLRSDGETAVTVYRVARLGSFEQRTLPLRPGEYTAVGTRPGYRDVRRTFRVTPEDPPGPVTIACTEKI